MLAQRSCLSSFSQHYCHDAELYYPYNDQIIHKTVVAIYFIYLKAQSTPKAFHRTVHKKQQQQLKNNNKPDLLPG